MKTYGFQMDKKKILVVEDHPLNMKLVVDLLELNGYEVLKAARGEDALDILGKEIPDIIIVDIHLPGMNGVELLRKIREDSRFNAVKVMALTATVMGKEKNQMLKIFDSFIMKPIDTKDFIRRVKMLIDKKDENTN
ncbi:MAG: response regulator [Candidatus Omnitrophota bacterium]